MPVESQPTATKANVVIVGGGIAGTTIARELSAKLDSTKHNLILVTPRPFSVFLPALVRAVVTAEGDYGTLDKGALVPFDRLFHNGAGTVKVGVVSAVEADPSGNSGAVILEDGEHIDYKVLVLATGTEWANPINIPNTEQEAYVYLETWRERFRTAKHVVIVGGGAVGIEIAGELKDLYPEKPVSLVHGSSGLLNSIYPDSFRTRFVGDLTARGVEVVLDDRVEDIPQNGETPNGITTRKGKYINSDLLIYTGGGKPNTTFAKNSALQLTEKGHICVEPTLLAKGTRNVFVAGDIIDWNEQKQSAKIAGHASVVVPNVLNVINGKEAVTTYSGASELIAVTNGKKGGAAYFGAAFGLQLGGWFVRIAKRDLFVGLYRRGIGY